MSPRVRTTAQCLVKSCVFPIGFGLFLRCFTCHILSRSEVSSSIRTIPKVQGVKYFTARSNHGIFIRPGKVEKIKDERVWFQVARSKPRDGRRRRAAGLHSPTRRPLGPSPRPSCVEG